MQRPDILWLGSVALLAGLGLAAKLGNAERFVFADKTAASEALASRLVNAGFQLEPERFRGDWRRLARKGDCVLFAGIAGDMGQDVSLWNREAAAGGRLSYWYRGTARSEFPRFRAPLEDQMQRQFARVGILIERPAVVATIQRGNCITQLPDITNVPMPVARSPRVYSEG